MNNIQHSSEFSFCIEWLKILGGLLALSWSTSIEQFLCFHVGISWRSSCATPKSNVAFRCRGSGWSTPYIFCTSFSKFLPHTWSFLSAVQISWSTQQKAFPHCICFNYSFTWKAPQRQRWYQSRKSWECCSWWQRRGCCGRRMEAELWLKEFPQLL